MGRPKGCKNFKKGEEPWLKYGLSSDAYYRRLKKGLPLDQKLKPGRKPDVEMQEAIGQFGKSALYVPVSVKEGRFSGLEYENPPEKLGAIREKYKNGITPEILAELMESF